MNFCTIFGWCGVAARSLGSEITQLLTLSLVRGALGQAAVVAAAVLNGRSESRTDGWLAL